jgi:hypothetical protein
MRSKAMWVRGLVLMVMLAGAPLTAQREFMERSLPGADRVLVPEMSDVFTVGTIEGGDWEAFGRIRSIAFGPDGDLFVLDQQAREVHRVSPSGEYRGTVGREGAGPGEFQVPTGLTVAPDGRIVIRDTGRSSWAVFAPDGTYIDNLRVDGSLGRPSTLRFAADGSIVSTPNDLVMVENGRLRRTYLVEGGEDPTHVDRLPVLALDADGRNPRVIDEMWMAPRDVVDGGQLREMAFLAAPHWDVLPDGRAVVVDSLAWEVRLVGSHLGVPDQRLTRAIAPRRVTDRMREREIERRAALPNGGRSGGMVAFGGSEEENRRAIARAAEERLRAGLGFPEVRQVIREVKVDPAGRIWVARTPEAVEPEAPGPVDVLDPSGRYLGTIESFALPDAFGPDGLAAWVGEGDFDVPIVTVRRVRLPG